MTQVALEQQDTKQVSNNAGKLAGRRTFHVYDDDAAITSSATISFGQNGLPAIGDRFPDDAALFAESYAINHLPDSNYVWRVEISYSSGGGAGTNVTTPDVVGYIQISLDYGGQFKDWWRAPNFSNLLADGLDIGGAKIDAAGIPLSFFVAQHRMILEETVLTSTVAYRTSAIRNSVAKRNSRPFFGAAEGTLLYEGASARRLGLTTFSITHKFLYDEYFHQGQQPKMNANREPVIEMASQPFASWVRWVQPYTSQANFSLLSENF